MRDWTSYWIGPHTGLDFMEVWISYRIETRTGMDLMQDYRFHAGLDFMQD